ncbi:uncharacterized protein LOC118744165 [Rhagoletis pomonella]|uniref:uncharacterized protein LOC118744165 n=1 Tax=Rhagoletis pomonella TaxID=28610 RepID=UPI001785FA3E|nr:uncharacterized protein LOC118744165 [Rhagoletis pomonella]
MAIGVTLFKLGVTNVKSANDILRNKKLQEKQMRAFIPRSFIETYGVIRDIPLDITEDEIKSNAISEVKITSVQRFTRRESSESENRIPTFSVKIGFASNNLPKEIKLNYTIIEVEYFYPFLRQCLNCGRLGHTGKACRANKRIRDVPSPGGMKVWKNCSGYN